MMSNPDSNEPIRVIIADDHVLYRAGVKTALSAKKDVKVVAEADNGMHLLNMIKNVPSEVMEAQGVLIAPIKKYVTGIALKRTIQNWLRNGIPKMRLNQVKFFQDQIYFTIGYVLNAEINILVLRMKEREFRLKDVLVIFRDTIKK